MEARRNLEAVYKRRLDEAEKKKFQLELQLELLKVYLSLSSQEVRQTDEHINIIMTLRALEDEIKKALSSVAVGTPLSQESVWENSGYISKLQFDLIEFKTESILLSEIVESSSLSEKDNTHYEVSSSSCVNTDVEHLRTVLSGFAYMTNKYMLVPEIVVSHDSTTSTLSFALTDADGRILSFLGNAWNTVDSIISSSATAKIDETNAAMFLCRALAQSMGGDLIKTEKGFSLDIPCEIMPDDRCPVPNTTVKPVKNLEKKSPPLESTPRPPSPPQPELPKPVVTSPAYTEPKYVPAPSKSSEKKEEVRPAKTLKGTINILIAEDNVIIQKMFVRSWKGHNVFTASTGPEALDLFKERNFNIVFLDIEIPLLDGIAVAKEMRSWEQQRGKKPTPIIGMSGSSTKQYKERSLEGGMNDFINKGEGMGQITDMVMKYLAD